jgi:hypothetical protein
MELEERLSTLTARELGIILTVKAKHPFCVSIIDIITNYLRLYNNSTFELENILNIVKLYDSYNPTINTPNTLLNNVFNEETDNLFGKLARISILKQPLTENREIHVKEIVCVYYGLCSKFSLKKRFIMDIATLNNDPVMFKISLEKINNALECCLRVIRTGYYITNLTNPAWFSNS